MDRAVVRQLPAAVRSNLRPVCPRSLGGLPELPVGYASTDVHTCRDQRQLIEQQHQQPPVFIPCNRNARARLDELAATIVTRHPRTESFGRSSAFVTPGATRTPCAFGSAP